MNKEQLIEKIEDWLDDLLPEQEAAEIQFMIENEPDMRVLVDQIKARRMLVIEVQADHYLEKMKLWEKDTDPPGADVVRPKYNLLFIVIGSLVLLIAVCIVLRDGERAPDPEIEKVTDPVPPGTNVSPGMAQTMDKDKHTVDKTIPPPTTQQPVKIPKGSKIVLRFLSEKPFEEGIKDNFIIDTVQSGTLGQNWTYVSQDVVVENNYDFMEEELGTSRGDDFGDPPQENQISLFKQARTEYPDNPKKAIKFLLDIDDTNRDYSKAQHALAFLFLDLKDYRQAVICYERYHARNQLPDTDWMLLGFYLHDYKNSKVKAKKLLNDIKTAEHKYKTAAEEVEDCLK